MSKLAKGFTLIEVVVALGVFGLLSVTLSLLLISTLRGSKKASSIIEVRGEGSYALEAITSQLRFAKEITSCTGDSLIATTRSGDTLNFACLTSGEGSLLASGSAQITSANVQVLSCSGVFSCPADLRSVRVAFTLLKAGSELAIEDSASIDFESDITLRNN